MVQPYAKGSRRPQQGRQPGNQRKEIHQHELVFPERVNGKTPDQMNPEEFEQYLGLRGPDDPSSYATAPQARKITALDRIVSGELHGMVEDSYSQPVVSAAAHNSIGRETITDSKGEAKPPGSMFDSFDQEEKRLIDQLAASEQTRKMLSPSKYPPKAANKSKFEQKVNVKEF